MIEIDEQNLPFVRTGQALLLLDLQNDFIETGALLPVKDPPGFIDNTVKLLPEFRAFGHIIWIRSIFEASRPFNEAQGESENESVITDNELRPSLHRGDRSLKARAALSQHFAEQNSKTSQTRTMDCSTASPLVVDDSAEENKEVDSVEETFLTVCPGQKPKIVLATSPGTNFAEFMVMAADIRKDLFAQKTYYSAFKDGNLVQTLRAKFVTEIYICGALTNIGIFATAMDAARHGYAITIIEDCVGYRSKARHDEALRRLREFAGCDVVSSADIIESLRAKTRIQQAPRHPRPQRPKEKNAGLENLMASLNLGPEGIPASTAASNSTGLSEIVAESINASIARLAVDQTTESPEVELPIKTTDVDGKKRERVKSKVKSRRRHSKSTPKDIGVPGDSGRSSLEKGPLTPTSDTLLAASQAVKKLPKPALTERHTSASLGVELSTSVVESDDLSLLVLESQPKATKNGVTVKDSEVFEPPTDQGVEMEKAPAEVGLFSICEGDTSVIHDLLNDKLEKGIFEKVRDEVRWQKMSHQGGDVPRLVVVQGEVGEDGSIPIYRHPADESPPLLPFSPTVSLIRAEVEKRLGHPVNHALIQFYRDGSDYISEHSDKTLDIVPKTFIANVSLGAQRTMVFRTKKPRKTDETVSSVSAQPREAIRAALPHNSLCRMGLVTNMRWLHSIRQDKRPVSEKTPEELAYGSGRISLTFRLIGTFLDKNQEKIWGQGAVAKTKEEARTVINGKTDEAEKMVWAFGTENHSSEFDWEETYGEGFDVLHMSSSPKLFLSGDKVADLRVKLILAEYGIAWTEGKLSPSFNWKGGSSSNDIPAVPEVFPVKFIDSDLSKSTVIGDLAILQYLDAVYGPLANNKAKSRRDLAKLYTRMYQTGDLLKLWRAVPFNVGPFRRELEMWETYAEEAKFIAGPTISVADYALWPILAYLQKELSDFEGFDHLTAYCSMLRKRDSIIKLLGPTKRDGASI
jgi:nicotinamidase-related amidase